MEFMTVRCRPSVMDVIVEEDDDAPFSFDADEEEVEGVGASAMFALCVVPCANCVSTEYGLLF